MSNLWDVELFMKFQSDPFIFVEYVWWLTPQKRWEPFIKGQHLTWQQVLIFRAVKNALHGLASRKISITSGHWVGKSSALAMLIIWFLICFKDAQVPCTAPTQNQLYDVLWKELAKWISMMPKQLQDMLDLQWDYLRVHDYEWSDRIWFARAKTGKKENAEALAGIHGDYILQVADEASGVADEIFENSKGAMTGKNLVIFIMISNPTRTEGYFYRSHHELQHTFQCLTLNGEESPIVDTAFINDIIDEYGKDSDQYKIRVKWEFPSTGIIDDKGYTALLSASDLKFISYDDADVRPTKLWVDPSWEGNDDTVMVDRDNFMARVVFKEGISDEKSIADKVCTWHDLYEYVNPSDIVIDNFWVGANVGVELALVGKRVSPVNVWDRANKKDMFANKRAECFWALRDWIMRGGILVGSVEEWKDLLMIKFKRNLAWKIQIMPKDLMRKLYGKSPDTADAFSLTFYNPEINMDRAVSAKWM